MAEAILQAFKLHGLKPKARVRQRLLDCRDTKLLKRWLGQGHGH